MGLMIVRAASIAASLQQDSRLLTKKPWGIDEKAVSCACCADLLKVAITVPILIPDKCTACLQTRRRANCMERYMDTNLSTQAQSPSSAEQGKQRHDLGDNNFRRAGGDMISCSIVPASRSFTIAADATSELFRISKRPKTQSQ